jgi:hypothetical protein
MEVQNKLIMHVKEINVYSLTTEITVKTGTATR